MSLMREEMSWEGRSEGMGEFKRNQMGLILGELESGAELAGDWGLKEVLHDLGLVAEQEAVFEELPEVFLGGGVGEELEGLEVDLGGVLHY